MTKDVNIAIAQLAALVRESGEYSEFRALSLEYESDAGVQEKVDAFNLLRDKLVAARGADTKDMALIGSLQKQMQDSYTALMKVPVMENYTEAKMAFDKYVQHLHTRLNHEIFGTGACTSDCDSCGGCR